MQSVKRAWFDLGAKHVCTDYRDDQIPPILLFTQPFSKYIWLQVIEFNEPSTVLSAESANPTNLAAWPKTQLLFLAQMSEVTNEIQVACEQCACVK